MSFNKLNISEKSSQRLSLLKGRTGLESNSICRLAICISLNDPSIPNPKLYDNKGRELNKHELFGDYEKLIIALIKQRCFIDGFNPKIDFKSQLLVHLNRGISIVANRVKNLSDIKNLFV